MTNTTYWTRGRWEDDYRNLPRERWGCYCGLLRVEHTPASKCGGWPGGTPMPVRYQGTLWRGACDLCGDPMPCMCFVASDGGQWWD